MPVLACTGLWGHVILHTLAQRHLTPGASSLQGAHGVPENSQESHTVAWGRHTVSFAFSSFPSRLPLPRCPLLVLLLQTFLLSTNSISLDATEHFSSLWEWQTWKFLIFFFLALCAFSSISYSSLLNHADAWHARYLRFRYCDIFQLILSPAYTHTLLKRTSSLSFTVIETRRVMKYVLKTKDAAVPTCLG